MIELNKIEYFYIYNFVQAKFFINNGLKVIEIGKGSKGDIYHKFIRDEKSEKVFYEWKRRKYGDKAI